MTSLERAAEDYAFSVGVLWPYTDFFVVNVSSPNTPNLRQLQDKGALEKILKAIEQRRRGGTTDRSDLMKRSEKAPSSKLQAPEKLQIPSTNFPRWLNYQPSTLNYQPTRSLFW